MSAALPFLTAAAGPNPSGEWHEDPDLWLYRDRTTALLRRYLHLSVEVGRLPSLLGREFFRARVTSYRMTTFEDAVIFVHDVEKAIERLDPFAQQLIARVVLQEYTEVQAARFLHCSVRTVQRHLPLVLDELSSIFLHGSLLTPMGGAPAQHGCQDDKRQRSCSSCCHCTK
jgi:hypothetical protein